MKNTYNLFDKLKKSLLNTKKKITDNIHLLIYNKKIDQKIIQSIENQLLIADINIHTIRKMMQCIKNKIKKNNNENFLNLLKHEMLKILLPIEQPLLIKNKKPFIILIIGINGSGKTTTIGKLAYHYQKKYKNIILAAGDIHRSGAIEQLKILGKNIGCTSVISNNSISDATAIIFEAIHIAKLKSSDLLIIDTAGRLQNKTQSMQELNKINQAIKKIDPEIPHETILILDANIGQNSVQQVHAFNKLIKITGIIMTKLDGSAKGGTLLSIADHFSIPIRYIGIGQKMQDLQPFNAKNFVKAIIPSRNDT